MANWDGHTWANNIVSTVQGNRAAELRELFQREDFKYFGIGEYPWGNNPLGLAVQYDSAEMVETLINAGVKIPPHSRDGYGNTTTALKTAMQNGNAEIVTLLVTAGTEVNEFFQNAYNPITPYHKHNSMNITVLIHAVELGKFGMSKLLLELGADPNIYAKNTNDSKVGWYTPLHVAIQLNKPDIARLLLEFGANINDFRIMPHYEEQDSAFLSGTAGKYLSTSRFIGKYTALHLAIWIADNVLLYDGMVDMVKLLLEFGADVAVKGFDDRAGMRGSAVDWARMLFLNDIVKLLTGHKGTVKLNMNSTDDTQLAEELSVLDEEVTVAQDKTTTIVPNDPQLIITLEKVNSKAVKEEELNKALEIKKQIQENKHRLESLEAKKRKLMEENKSWESQPDFRSDAQIELLQAELVDIRKIVAAVQELTTPKIDKSDIADSDDKNCTLCSKPPEQVFSCIECDNWLCGNCVGQFANCPSCRQDFTENPARRNKGIERLLLKL